MSDFLAFTGGALTGSFVTWLMLTLRDYLYFKALHESEHAQKVDQKP